MNNPELTCADATKPVKYKWIVSVARWANAITILTMLLLLIPPKYNHWTYDKLLFPWSPYIEGDYPKELFGATRQELYIPVNGGTTKLHAWLFERPGARQIAILHHGQAGNIVHNLTFAYHLLSINRSVLMYDYSGYGKSTGIPSVENICRDGEAAYSWLIAAKGYQPKQIINVGVSLGTGVASTVAQRHPCAGIILLSPYSSLHALARKHLVWLNLYDDGLLDYPDLGSTNLLAGNHPPTFMMHGCNDDVIPVEQADAIAKVAAQPLTYVRLENAGHIGFFGPRTKQTLSEICHFMDSLTST